MKPNAANYGIYRVRKHRAGGSGPEMFLCGATKKKGRLEGGQGLI